MIRRDFLRAAGLASGALALQMGTLANGATVLSTTEAESQGKLYRAMADGKINVSADAGKSWQLHADFGAEFTVVALAADRRGQVSARLVSDASRFDLTLAQNGKAWKTA